MVRVYNSFVGGVVGLAFPFLLASAILLGLKVFLAFEVSRDKQTGNSLSGCIGGRLLHVSLSLAGRDLPGMIWYRRILVGNSPLRVAPTSNRDIYRGQYSVAIPCSVFILYYTILYTYSHPFPL